MRCSLCLKTSQRLRFPSKAVFRDLNLHFVSTRTADRHTRSDIKEGRWMGGAVECVMKFWRHLIDAMVFEKIRTAIIGSLTIWTTEWRLFWNQWNVVIMELVFSINWELWIRTGYAKGKNVLRRKFTVNWYVSNWLVSILSTVEVRLDFQVVQGRQQLVDLKH